MPITHILFDFFGTLVEYSKDPIGKGFASTYTHLKNHGYEAGYDAFIDLWSQIYRELDSQATLSHREFSMDELTTEVIHRIFAKPDPALSRTLAMTFMSEWNRGVTYLPGLRSLLQGLREDYVLAVVSNTHEKELVPGHLSTMGVSELFQTVVTSVGFGIRKPNRAIFEHTLEVLNTTPEQCVYVGDNYEVDFRGATAAGIKALLLDPQGVAPVPGHARIDSVHSLTNHVLT